MKVISVLNMKGGVGKTTISFNLADSLARMGNKVLTIDLDPQSSLTQYVLGVDEALSLFNDGREIVLNIFDEESNKLEYNKVVYTTEHGFDLIPSSLRLSKALVYPHDKVILGFNKFLNKIKEHSNYDFIIIDCPPFESVFNRATYHVSDFILNPITISKFSLLGLVLLKESIDEYSDLYNHKLNGATVINAFDKNDKTMEYLRLLGAVEQGVDMLENSKNLNWGLFEEKIKFTKSHKTAVQTGQALENTKFCHLSTKRNFQEFVDELLDSLEDIENK